MSSSHQFSPDNYWHHYIDAASGWVTSSDRHTRHRSHRWLGREIKRLVLALGGREVGRRRPTGHPRAPRPMTTSLYEIDSTAVPPLEAALPRLADRIRRRS
ncbi:MAG: hypothetical protein ACREMX_16205 [Gemmatimonadales bacterium]